MQIKKRNKGSTIFFVSAYKTTKTLYNNLIMSL